MRPQILAKLKDPRTNWKYVLIVVILAFIIGGGISWFQSQVTREIISLTQLPQIKRLERKKEIREQEEDKNKEIPYEEVTYTNKKFGFEFKYPKTYAENNWAQAREKENFVLVGARIEIGIFDNRGLTLTEYVDEYVRREFLEEEGFTVESKENMIVGGEEAIRVSFRFGGMGRYGERIFVLHDQKIYIFNMTAGGKAL